MMQQQGIRNGYAGMHPGMSQGLLILKIYYDF